MLRSILAALILIVVCLTVPIATTAWWTRATVTEADRFVETLEPVATEPAVTALVERRVSSRIIAQIDKAEPIERAAQTLRSNGMALEAAMLPILAEPLRQETISAVKRVTHQVVTSPRFAKAWVASLEEVHPQLVAALEDKPNEVVDVTDDGILTLKLATLTKAVSRSLKEAEIPGTERLAAVDISVPVTNVENLETAQTGYGLLNMAGRWLPIAVAALLVLGLVLARRRVRAAAWTAFGIAVMLALTLVGVGIGRRTGVDALPADTRGAGDTMFGVLTSTLHTVIWILIAAAAVVAVALAVVSVGRLIKKRAEVAQPS